MKGTVLSAPASTNGRRTLDFTGRFVVFSCKRVPD
jgi:hypothetical protein